MIINKKAYAGQASQCEKQCCNIFRLEVGSTVRVVFVIGHVVLFGQMIEPAVLGLGQSGSFDVGYGVEHTGQPVTHQRKHGH